MGVAQGTVGIRYESLALELTLDFLQGPLQLIQLSLASLVFLAHFQIIRVEFFHQAKERVPHFFYFFRTFPHGVKQSFRLQVRALFD